MIAKLYLRNGFLSSWNRERLFSLICFSDMEVFSGCLLLWVDSLLRKRNIFNPGVEGSWILLK